MDAPVAGSGLLRTRQTRRIAALRRTARLLDSAFRVPGTRRRIGIDPIVGLVPGYGDLVAPLFTLVLLWQARELGLPRLVQVRMVVNAGIDAVIGTVPLLGDLFDFAWKANQRNVALLERYARDRRPTLGDRLFLALLLLLALALAAVPVLILVTVVTLVARLAPL